jgi:thiamine biosynthesis protein ThiI
MTPRRIILVRYDEIGLKGNNRRFFENRLLDNIRLKLRKIEGARFQMPRGRLLVEIDVSQADDCVKLLQWVPGIASFSVGVPLAPDPEIVAELGVQWIEPLLASGKSLRFCVKTQRSDKSFPLTSPEFSFEAGSRIMTRLSERGLSVDLTNPEFALEVEIGSRETVVFKSRVAGLRGLPVGTAGSVLTLLSGGIDSPVAAHMMIRRGCRSHFVFFDNRTFLGRGGYDKVLRLARAVNRCQDRCRLYVVPFEEIQTHIRDHCRPSNRVVLYRRMMYRIARAIAESTGCLGLVTGESLGQVASQTLENLAAVSCVTQTSVFRPLIGMDKVDIIARARVLGTFDISIEAQPDCCSIFMPPKPVIKSKIPELENDEQAYPWQALQQTAMERMEIVDISEE